MKRVVKFICEDAFVVKCVKGFITGNFFSRQDFVIYDLLFVGIDVVIEKKNYELLYPTALNDFKNGLTCPSFRDPF